MPFFRANGLTSPLFQQLNTSVAASASAADGKVMGQGPFGTKYYLQGALAGGICCSITHGALTPVDVVKTRIQLDPVKYNQGFIGGFKQVIADEGAGALLTGLGPTAQGYFIQVSGVLRSNAARAGAWVGGGAPSGARGVLRRGGGAALASPPPDVARWCVLSFFAPLMFDLRLGPCSRLCVVAGLVQVWRRRVFQDQHHLDHRRGGGVELQDSDLPSRLRHGRVHR